jgi:hypothetical protein
MHKHKYYFQVGCDFVSDMDGELSLLVEMKIYNKNKTKKEMIKA